MHPIIGATVVMRTSAHFNKYYMMMTSEIEMPLEGTEDS